MKSNVRMLSSDISHMALHYVWRDSGVTARHGFELTVDVANADVFGQPVVQMDERAEKLLSGEYDFLSGLHHQTYTYRSKGDKRFVYLAQAQNDWDDRLIGAPDIKEARDLEGKRVIVGTPAPCVYGNFKHALAVAGVDVDKVDFDVWREFGSDISLRAVKEVLNGHAAAAAVDVPFDDYGRRNGLNVIEIPELPVIHNATMCANREWVKQNEDTVAAFLTSMVEAIHFFKTRKDEACAILKRTLAPLIGADEEGVEHLQRYWAKRLVPKPYPHPLAVWNVYQLDILHDPATNIVSPLEMWDLGYLRDLDDTGFIDDLYGGIAAAAAPEVHALI